MERGIKIIPIDDFSVENGISTLSYGKPLSATERANEKSILLLGEQECGKTTMINAMMNYIAGVKFEDDYRVKLSNMTREGSTVKNYRDGIVIHKIYPKESGSLSSLPYTLNIIDTPGISDKENSKRNEDIVPQIRCYINNYIGVLDAICLIINSNIVRIGDSEKYVFEQIKSLIGSTLKKKTFILANKAESENTVVIDALNNYGLQFADYFLFENGSIYQREGESEKKTRKIRDRFDDGQESFEGLFTKLNNLRNEKTKSDRDKPLLNQKRKINDKCIKTMKSGDHGNDSEMMQSDHDKEEMKSGDHGNDSKNNELGNKISPLPNKIDKKKRQASRSPEIKSKPELSTEKLSSHSKDIPTSHSQAGVTGKSSSQHDSLIDRQNSARRNVVPPSEPPLPEKSHPQNRVLQCEKCLKICCDRHHEKQRDGQKSINKPKKHKLHRKSSGSLSKNEQECVFCTKGSCKTCSHELKYHIYTKLVNCSQLSVLKD